MFVYIWTCSTSHGLFDQGDLWNLNKVKVKVKVSQLVLEVRLIELKTSLAGHIIIL
jgi:hypothetical protein